MQLLLGIDAGTTSVKVGLFQPDGSCLAVERYEYRLSTPMADRAELDPEIYWQACVSSTRKVLERADTDPYNVIALSVSSQGETVITLDNAGKPIYPAMVWIDNRATREAQQLANLFSRQAYPVTGTPEIIPTWTACKILWLKQNEPDIFNRADKFLLVQDYLIYRLTGEFFTNNSVSCTSLYYDIVRDQWWQPMLEEIGITIRNLPELASPGSVVGKVSKEASHETGLPTTTQVIVGGMDQSVGAIGAGNIQPGIVSETTGAALTIQTTIPSPDIDKNQTIPVYSHSVPGRYLFVPVCPTAGMAYKWFRDTFATPEINQALQDDLDSYDLLNDLASAAHPGCDGLIMLPHLMGAYSPNPNPAARGSFSGFTLSHNRSHFARAILEGVAFLLKHNLEIVQNTGIEVKEIRSTGGGARSPLWNQIKANVNNLPVVTLVNEDTALLGNAILAGVASGIFSKISEGCEKMVAVREKVMPDEQMQAYIKPYQMYRDLDNTLEDYYKRHYRETSNS